MRMLDLFCGGGLAAAGYWQSGCFSEIVGVDHNPRLGYVYPFDFICQDAMKLDYEFLMSFDFIHASPPCQAYSRITPRSARQKHMRLIAATHLMLTAAGTPYVIENVPGSGAELKPNLILSGRDVGVPMGRERLFHISTRELINDLPGTEINMNSAVNFNVHGDVYVSRDELIEAFGLKSLPASHLKRLTMPHIEQGIPPAMTRWIAEQLFEKFMVG